ncbi:MAG: PD40 domain-containing protein [Gemmatimonadetes bacterium]|nr:PD40 domain-containing protein [Gemmatimonadota bacterium]
MSRARWLDSGALRLAALLAALAAACREAPAPFDAPDRIAEGEQPLARLSYSLKDDRAPVWAPGGDSVYYAAEGFDPLPRTRGVLVGIPRLGGTADPVLPDVQHPRATLWLTTPAVAPAGDRIAYAEVSFLWHPVLCPGALRCSSGDTVALVPPLAEATLRVRRFGETRPPEQDPGLSVRFAGRFYDGDAEVYRTRFHPFQRLFVDERALVFRPSWAPDGRRLVYSDGLRLLVWTVGSEPPVPVPGTEDGVSAAWSPDGSWIAYSRLERADSTKGTCVYLGALGTICVDQRTEYRLGRRLLTLVRPDGRERRELGTGEEPAWAPDGQTLYFRRDNRIWRIRLDGSGAQPVAQTEGGREPAVSPDGRYLAFARRVAPANHDVWVLSLAAPQPAARAVIEVGS